MNLCKTGFFLFAAPLKTRAICHSIALVIMLMTLPVCAEMRAGIGVGDITPPVGTPSAGYGDRAGKGMTGVHDPLLATALVLDNGTKRVVFVGVDHLGFMNDMVDAVKERVAEVEGADGLEIYVSSSHSHSAGGAYLNIPILGQILAGKYDQKAVEVYVSGTVDAIVNALGAMEPAKVGIGYGHAPGMNSYRGDWPPNVSAIDDVALIKVTRANGSPLAALFNFAAHPTVLSGRNLDFSADFVGFSRDHIREQLGVEQAIYINGAQGDVSARAPGGDDDFARSDALGKALADVVATIWEETAVSDEVEVVTANSTYILKPTKNSTGTPIPIAPRPSEVNLIVFDKLHAFVTIPGELSTIYDADIRRFGGWLGYEHVSVFGLTNDAHGYIITPEAWRHQTYESTVSFGGEMYGEEVKSRVYALLHALEPAGSYHEDKRNSSELLAPVEGSK